MPLNPPGRSEGVSMWPYSSSGISVIAKATGLTRQTIYRIQADPVAAEATLTIWEEVRR